jgi:hypothetical protein
MSTTNNNSRKRYSASMSKTGGGGGGGGGGKFCKICKDIGKTRDEYTSHYVRETPNPSSRVLCPVLLSSVCRYCKEGGHTVKHCPKIGAKNQNVKDAPIVCTETDNNKKEENTSVSRNNFSALADLDFRSDDEDEVVVITPPNKSVVSYASALQKVALPSKINMPSQVESLIPTKLNFGSCNVVTLEKITKRWADEEDPDDCEILYTTLVPPIPFDENHPLGCFVSFVDVLVSDYTDNFAKSIAITSDAFQQLCKNWEAEFFNINAGGRDAFEKSPTTNTRTRSIIMTERYIQ